jgi:ubiquitin-conjugating enzyme E2 Q
VEAATVKRVVESKTSSSPVKAPVKKRIGQDSSTIAASYSATTSSASTIADPTSPSTNDPPQPKSKKRTLKHKSIESIQLPTPGATPTATTPLPQPVPEPELEPDTFVPEAQTLPSYATSSATKVLQKQLKQIIKSQLSTTLGQERYWTLDLHRLDNLYTWYFTLSSFDPDIPLSADMRSYGINSVHLEVKFGPQHPNSPPFVRIIKPRFMQWMNGGGGHVTAGGSICVEMLTMKGWKREYTLEQVLLVVHQALSDVDPVPARLIGNYEYGVQEAVNAYIRVANSHGWRVPQNWNTLFTRN